MLGKGQGKERARLLTLLGMCAGEVKVFANVSAGADTKANTLGAAAHLSSEILVSLRTAASAEAPWAPMLLSQRL